ncbi:hypothetical protein [Paenibacillus plantarum]|uniref:hypothetical protein n=1 Tax=Paenibacillus plantarum TaxID=2654975 RepID=UPI0014909581|nr:hypothetical protein [Paenibacillus plantarum]
MSTRKEQEPLYTKEQFIGSQRFTGAQKDILGALLVDGESYTNSKVIDLINEFLERTVQ